MEIRFPDNGNVFGSRDGILGKPGLAGVQKKVCRVFCFVDARRKRNHQDRVRPLVAIAGVMRNDNDRAPSFLRGIDRQLDKPNFSSEWRSEGRRHLAGTFHELGQGEFSPSPFLGLSRLWQGIVKTGNRLLDDFSLPLFVQRAKKVIQDCRDRPAPRTAS